jgi:calcium-dependent protein kinase
MPDAGETFKDIVGSAYYVAPEMLKRHHGAEADIWSAGVILVFFFCFTEFQSVSLPLSHSHTCFLFISSPENEDGIFDAVLHGHIDFTSDPWPSISSGAKDLVKKMLRQDPKERLTAAEILSMLAVHLLCVYLCMYNSNHHLKKCTIVKSSS